jgi:uncharacterized repeat protein (TIGR03803 family)
MHKNSDSLSIAGAVALGFVVLFASAGANSKEKTLYDFRGCSDGEGPAGSLIADGAGNLYGTTGGGGGGTGCDNGSGGCGAVFELSPDRHETVLYAFAGGSDGAFPNAGLAADNAGNLYGTTEREGNPSCPGGGCGTVFKLAPDGTESVLYAFQGDSDGWAPFSGLIADGSGNLYGETGYGGSYSGSDCEANGCGTVFEVQPDGTKSTLYNFEGGSDGAGPGFGLTLDSLGNFYGTTGSGGGSGCGGIGCGTVFKIAANGTESVLYAFQGGADGAGPVGVTVDSAGNLYGATQAGGTCTFDENNCGTVFKLAPDGTKIVLYNFQGGDDGLTPWAPLILDTKGDLYGTTFVGGGKGCKRPLAPERGAGCGTVFKVTPDGKETALYAFVHEDGANPLSGSLFLGAHGELYGAAPSGGKGKNGVVFEVKK